MIVGNLRPIHMGSQVPIMLASPNMEEIFQLLNLNKLLELGFIFIKVGS